MATQSINSVSGRPSLSAQELPFELASLVQAVRYQQWVKELVEPFLGSRILELGAGVGSMSRWMPVRERLILTEVDPKLFKLLESETAALRGQFPGKVSVEKYDFFEDSPERYFSENIDTIISFNVLEHIERDRDALEKLSEILRASKSFGPKRLITFVPAHQWAYGAMDRAFEHFRRYDRASFSSLAQQVAPEAKLHTEYFNLVGLLGWFVKGKILNQAEIDDTSVQIFEKICPLIKPFDRIAHKAFKLPLGQSLLAVLEWEPSSH